VIELWYHEASDSLDIVCPNGEIWFVSLEDNKWHEWGECMKGHQKPSYVETNPGWQLIGKL